MATAAIIQIADAVVVAINGQMFSAPYDLNLQAERLYDPVYQLKDLADLKVTVVAASVAGVLASRGKARDQRYEVDIAFQQKLPAPVTNPDTEQKINELLALIEEVGDFLFEQENLAGMAAVPVAIDNTPIYDPERMKSAEFLSVLTMTYQEMR